MPTYISDVTVTPVGTRSRKKLIDRLPEITSTKSVRVLVAHVGRTSQDGDAASLVVASENDDPNRIPADIRRAVRKAMGLVEVDVRVMVRELRIVGPGTYAGAAQSVLAVL